MTGNTDNSVLNKENAINNAKIKIIAKKRYVPHQTSSIENHVILTKQILIIKATEVQYVERIVSMKELKTQNSWTFELEAQEGLNILLGIYVGFQQQDSQGSQNLNNDIFYRAPVTSAQCDISMEKKSCFCYFNNS